MTSEMDSTDRIYTLMEECRRMNITVLPPDVNESEKGFSVNNEKIRFGLWAVKNVGEGAVEAIIEARSKEGKFKSLAEFVSRVNLKSLNRRTLESLISAGALDSLEGNRSQKYEAVEVMLEFGQKVQMADNTVDLFASNGETIERKEPALPDIRDWSLSKRLANEKAMLGFYVSGHPLDQYRSELKMFGTADTELLSQIKDGREVMMGGIISSVKTKIDKRGNRMAFVSIEDFKGTAEMIVFSDCFEKGKDFLMDDGLIMVSGRVSTREEEEPKIIVNDLFPLNALSERFDCQLVIKIDEDISERKLVAVHNALEKNKGKTPVLLAARRNGDEYYIKSKQIRVNPDNNLIGRLKTLLGDSSVYLQPPK
jgi:DNA polymerase-3 subunit alpha